MIYFIIGSLVIIVLGVFYVISVFNKLKTTAVNVDESFAGIETYLEERFDMLTKLISTADAEAKREINMVTDITKLRSAFHQAKTTEEKVEAGVAIENSIPNLLVTLENYPDPAFNEAFRQVQRSIMTIEDKISAARRNYNSNVAIFNKAIAPFPEFIIARLLGFQSKEMFEATASKREDVDINKLWNN